MVAPVVQLNAAFYNSLHVQEVCDVCFSAILVLIHIIFLYKSKTLILPKDF